ncbi:MAG: GH25 family lysozyme [Acidobacteriota bacterium]
MRKFILRWIVIAAAVLLILQYYGYIWHNEIFVPGNLVKGLDVSHHQGKIDWPELEDQEYHFVFIKATEGAALQDHYFQYNWRASKKAGFIRGAYHFYRANCSGAEQARNLINTVPRDPQGLPPVIDLEVDTRVNRAGLVKQLKIMVSRLERYYGRPPILYVNYANYNAFVKGDFSECDIWIADLYDYPKLDNQRKWTFWQYCNRGRVEGIPSYVDINVYNGDRTQLLNRYCPESET